MPKRKARVDKPWIASEFLKSADQQRTHLSEWRERSASPPDPALGLLYHEIADQAEARITIYDTIAARYGQTPSRTVGAGVGGTIGRLAEKVASLGSTPLDLVRRDASITADHLLWSNAWKNAFAGMGESADVADLARVVASLETQRDAFQECLTRLLTQRIAET